MICPRVLRTCSCSAKTSKMNIKPETEYNTHINHTHTHPSRDIIIIIGRTCKSSHTHLWARVYPVCVNICMFRSVL